MSHTQQTEKHMQNRACDSKGTVMNEQIQQVVCVIVMILLALFIPTVGSPSVDKSILILGTCAGFSKSIESKDHKYCNSIKVG